MSTKLLLSRRTHLKIGNWDKEAKFRALGSWYRLNKTFGVQLFHRNDQSKIYPLRYYLDFSAECLSSPDFPHRSVVCFAPGGHSAPKSSPKIRIGLVSCTTIPEGSLTNATLTSTTTNSRISNTLRDCIASSLHKIINCELKSLLQVFIWFMGSWENSYSQRNFGLTTKIGQGGQLRRQYSFRNSVQIFPAIIIH